MRTDVTLSTSDVVLEGGDPIVAWRGWRWSAERGLLLSVIRPTSWPTFRPLKAAPPLRSEPGGTWGGIHAWRTRGLIDRLLKIDNLTVPVWGEVSLWGDVQEHELGYRAELAYPLSIFVRGRDRALRSAIAGAYGVEVTCL